MISRSAPIVWFALGRALRARYDAARTIDAFSARLRADVDLDSVSADRIGVIHDTMHLAHASVWLRGTPR